MVLVSHGSKLVDGVPDLEPSVVAWRSFYDIGYPGEWDLDFCEGSSLHELSFFSHGFICFTFSLFVDAVKSCETVLDLFHYVAMICLETGVLVPHLPYFEEVDVWEGETFVVYETSLDSWVVGLV